MELPRTTDQLVAMMRRPEFGGPLRFVQQQKKGWQDSLSLRPEDMDRAVEEIAALVLRLPRGALDSTDKMLYRKALYPALGTILRAYARAARSCPEIKEDPQALEGLARKLTRYTSIQDDSGRAVNSALDLRLL